MTTPRKLTADDLWTYKEMGTIALSPDGRRVAFVVHSLNKEKNERHSGIYLLQLNEQSHAIGEPRQLTSGVKNDTSPVWASDSRRLLFLSDREEEKNQLWLIDTDGGEAHKLTNMLNGVSEASWSPDGQWIAFTAMISPSDDDEVLTGHKPLEESEKKKREEEERIRLRSTTKVWYRLDGRGFFEKFNKLFIMPAPASDDGLSMRLRFAASRRMTSIVTSLPGQLIALRSACCATSPMTVIARLLMIYGLSAVRRARLDASLIGRYRSPRMPGLLMAAR